MTDLPVPTWDYVEKDIRAGRPSMLVILGMPGDDEWYEFHWTYEKKKRAEAPPHVIGEVGTSASVKEKQND